MIGFALVRQSDAVVASVLHVDNLDNLALNIPGGHDVRSCDGLPVVAGEWHWTGETLAPIVPALPSLAHLRAGQWQQVKAARDRAEWAGCTTQLGRVDTDPDSQRKVSGSVQMAMIAQAAGAPFDLAWTMQDNRTVMHDAGAMIAMGVAVGQHVAACHAAAITKRAAIDAADTVEAIEAVDIEGGWPDA